MDHGNCAHRTWSVRCCRVAALVICCALTASVLAAGCAKRPPQAIATVQAALDKGNFAEAFTLAQNAVAADRSAARPLAEALVTWADRHGLAEDAAVYLAAAGIDATAPGPYIGLAKLFATYPPYQMSIEGRRQMVGFWKKGAAASSALPKDATAVAAAGALATAAGEYALAAELLPGDGDTQLRAGLWHLSRNDPASAQPYVAKARELLGERADVQMALAVSGKIDPVPIVTVVDVKTAIPRGSVIGVNATHAFVMYGSGTRCSIARVALADGATETIVPDCGRGAALSPDGAWLAFTTSAPWRGSCAIKIVSVDGRQERELTRTTADVLDVDWSTDGGMLVFASLEGLAAINADGTERRLLVASLEPGTEGGEWPTSARISPDGRRVAYITGYYESSGSVTCVSLTDGKSVVTDVQGATDVAWFGEQLVYGTSGGGGAFDGAIYIKDWTAPTTSARRLTPTMVDATIVALNVGREQVLLRLMLRAPEGPGFQQLLWYCNIIDGRVGLLPIANSESTQPFWATDGTVYYLNGDRLVGFRLR